MERTVALLRDAGFTVDQMLELLMQIKMLSVQAPQQARAILNQDTPLAYAIFQALLVMQVIDPNTVVQQVLSHQAAQSNQGAPAAAPPQPFPRPIAGLPPHAVPLPRSPIPPPPVQAYAASGPVATAATPAVALPPDQREMILRVLALTPEQVAAMPPLEQGAIAQIRQQFAGALVT